ncbi:MAG TPA: FtsQ-type POTRA domain-containing protein, partial [Candidatus Brocadiia bacterium]|nr:FtsQ-type POTRA domain-containing protein [Candidatus Brocadiia bacterium]
MARKQNSGRPILVPVPSRKREILKSILTVLIIASTIAGGGCWAVRSLWARMIQLDDFKLRPADQEIAGIDGQPIASARWLNEPALRNSWIAQSCKTNGVFGRWASLLERGLAASVRDALAQSPWVRQVIHVKRRFPNQLDIQVELRRPAFRAILPNGKTLLLDASGVVLDPEIYNLTEPLASAPAIRFPPQTQVPDPGQAVADEGVRGAMYLLDNLSRPLPPTNASVLSVAPLAEIVVEATPTDGAGYNRNLTIIPAAGGTIVWGRPPVTGRPQPPAEAIPDVKFRNLVTMLRQYAGSTQLYVIDLRFRDPIARPIAPPAQEAPPP